MISLEHLSRRQRTILRSCNIAGKGLEIGPSFNPVAPKRAGFDIEIIDHLDQEGLIEKYKNDPNTPKNISNIIEKVDYIWDGRSYTELTGKIGYYDYIISSHLIEHVPDLIGHLRDCSMLLKSDGVYSLVIPFKYYTFDRFRSCTTVKDCINSYMKNNHSKGDIAEYYLNVVTNQGRIAWNQSLNTSDYRFIYPIKDVLLLQKNTNYLDIHQSVFTPASFALLINDLNCLGYIDFQIIQIQKSEDDCEFYVVLRKNDVVNDQTNRMMLIQALEEETIEMYSEKAIKYTFQKNRLLKSQLNLRDQSALPFAYCIDKIDVGEQELEKSVKTISLTAEDTISIRGWVYAKDMEIKAGTPKTVYLGSGDYYYTATSQCRPDVLKAFGQSGDGENLGFYISIPACLLDRGKMLLELLVVLENDDYCSIDTEYVIGLPQQFGK